MATLIQHCKANQFEPARYEDKANGRTYSHIVGGLAWPVKGDPGFLVVLARDLDVDASGHYHYWLLAEEKVQDMGDLIRHAMDMRQQYQAQTWVGNVAHKPVMYLLGELMQAYGYKDRLYLDMAPHAGDPQGLSFYLPLIKECMKAGKKLLHLGEKSTIPGYLAQVRAEDLGRAPEDFPAVAALGYALAELYGYQAHVAAETYISYADRPGAWML